jgi:hypothetical protein
MNSSWRSPALFAGFAVSLHGALLGGCGPALRNVMPPAIDAAQTTIFAAEGSGELASAEAARDLSVVAAVSRLGTSLGSIDPAAPEFVRRAYLEASASGDFATADAIFEVMTVDDADHEVALARVATHLAAGRFAEARAEAWDRAARFGDQRAEWLDQWYTAFERDPVFFSAGPHTLEPGVDATGLESLGGGSTITLKVKLDDETVAAFKPAQTRLQSNYRSEIAAYRLCGLMHCGFQVPTNREVRISEDDFLDLYGLASLDVRTGYASNFSDLTWYTDDDGERWLYGTLKEWVPGFTNIPIEHTDAWTWLVSSWMTRERLELLTFDEAVNGFRGTEGDNTGGVIRRAEGATALDFARQVSNLHLFDFLINNWDRYSGIFYGTNCQFNHGRFVSIDNGASFQDESIGGEAWGTTRGRMLRVQIYSRSTVDALRWMDHDRTRDLLFPDSPYHDDEDERFELFWQRREWFLAWIDGEIADRGEDRVLVFD